MGIRIFNIPTYQRTVFTYDPQAFGDGGEIEDTPLKLIEWVVANQGGALLWLLFFDTTTEPEDGAVPLFMPTPVPAAGFAGPIAPVAGIDMLAGLWWASSTTPATLTYDNTQSLWPTVSYGAP